MTHFQNAQDLRSLKQRINLMLLNFSNKTSRQLRIRRFLELIHPVSGMAILDLGGWDGHLLYQIINTAGLKGGRMIVADTDPYVKTASRIYGFETVVLQKGSTLPFQDKEIDIVWCNSVIEHVTPDTNGSRLISGMIGDKDWHMLSINHQQIFASEVRRIAKSYFVQTPDRRFPIELHTGIPLASYLSYNHTIKLIRLLRRFWPRPIGYVDWNLLTVRDMRKFFPDGRIEVEKFLGIPKSIIAWKRG
jgi:hypothetical protein